MSKIFHGWFEAKPAFGGLSHIFLSILMYWLEKLVVGTSVVIVNIDTYEKNRTKGSQTDKQTYQPNVQTNTSHTGMQDRKLPSRFKLLHFIEINPLKQNGWGHIWIMSIFSSYQHVTCCHRIMSCSACAVWKGFLKKRKHISETPRRSPCALSLPWSTCAIHTPGMQAGPQTVPCLESSFSSSGTHSHLLPGAAMERITYRLAWALSYLQ